MQIEITFVAPSPMTGWAPKVSLYQAILGVQGVSRWALAKKVLKETPYAIARALRALIIQTLLVCLRRSHVSQG